MAAVSADAGFSSAVTSTVDRKIGFDQVYANQMHQSPKSEERMSNMEPAQRAQSINIMKSVSYGFPVFLLLILAVYSLLLWAAFNFGLGASTTYWQVLAVSWYAALPYLIVSVITFLTVQFGHDADAFDLKNPVGTNLGYYFADASPMLKAALSSIDVIKLWSVVLQVIGMAIISRKTILQSAVVVGIFWVLGVMLGTAGAAFS